MAKFVNSKRAFIIWLIILASAFFQREIIADDTTTNNRLKMMEEEIKNLKQVLKENGISEKAAFVKEGLNEITEVDLEREKKLDEILASYEASKKKEDEALNEFYFAKKTKELGDKGLASWFGDTSTKPFLENLGRNTYLGGYMDVEYRREEGGKKGFDQKRLIPFIYADVSDRVKFSTEIEFEHGGTDNNRSDGEVKIEFATIDFLINDWINFRAGIILSPLGKFNLVHDSPILDLVDRPLVNRRVIPTTLSESGAGFFGTFYLGEKSKLDYQIYAVNGFEGLTAEGESRFSTGGGTRGGRGSQKIDFNGDPSVVGRLAYSPFLGLEFGGSFHYGPYDEKNDNDLTIIALDTTYQNGPFEFVGEFANAFLEQDSFTRGKNSEGDTVTDVVPDNMWGYYIEPRYHFMPEWLQTVAPTIFREESTFTSVIRWEQLDLDGAKTDRLTFGLNFRYTEDTVFKVDYQINTTTKEDEPSESNNNTLLFGMATYF